jgi:hypothetical protein
MNRYIDADALKKTIDKEIFRHDTIDHVFQIIDDAPSIDIVRCRECEYWNTKDCREGVGECEWAYYMTKPDDFCSYGSRSEKPNNCEHITEDGVTCARYPACDDCPDNPLNKVKGSERLVKGSEVTTDCRQLERSNK